MLLILTLNYFCLGPHSTVFRAYFYSIQRSFLVVLRESYIVPGIEFKLTPCKSNYLPVVIYLNIIHFCSSFFLLFSPFYLLCNSIVILFLVPVRLENVRLAHIINVSFFFFPCISLYC